MFARALFARPLLRIAARPLPRQLPPQPQVTARRLASTAPNLDELIRSEPRLRETFEKLSRHPPAIVAMQNVSKIIQERGFEPGTPPSMLEVMKLMMDKEFQEAAQTLTEEMQNAGIEKINPDVFMKMMEGK